MFARTRVYSAVYTRSAMRWRLRIEDDRITLGSGSSPVGLQLEHGHFYLHHCISSYRKMRQFMRPYSARFACSQVRHVQLGPVPSCKSLQQRRFQQFVSERGVPDPSQEKTSAIPNVQFYTKCAVLILQCAVLMTNLCS
jgi:hypothetical protein